MIEDIEDVVGIMAALEPETEQWLEAIAQTCLAHMHYMEDNPVQDLDYDDYGLLELERGFLTLYALHKKGALPSNEERAH